MDESTRTALQEELFVVDRKIESLHAQIQSVCWRQSPEGNRRNTGGQDDAQVASCARQVLTAERRLPPSQRVALMRRELSTALQRYLTLQLLLRKRSNRSDCT